MSLLAKSRQTIKKLVETPFMQGWQWKVKFTGMPEDFDIYVKDIEYGGFTLEYEDKQIGGQTFSSPSHKTAGSVTMTVRDHQDRRVKKAMKALAKKVINDDGTINLPPDYLFEMTLFVVTQDGAEIEDEKWQLSAAECGSIMQDRSTVTEFISFPVVFKKYKALGKVSGINN